VTRYRTTVDGLDTVMKSESTGQFIDCYVSQIDILIEPKWLQRHDPSLRDDELVIYLRRGLSAFYRQMFHGTRNIP
jgi:hypothetical protein